MANPFLSDQKQQLRRRMRQLMKASEPHPEPILQKLAALLDERPTLKNIALYSPLPGEIDLTGLVRERPEIRWLFPRVEERELVLHHVTDLEKDLQPGAFGIAEPRIALPPLHFSEIDAFLCPGLAFDPFGGRLGRGRGFYDRMLESARADALKIGICRKEQIVPDTFSEVHDVMMDQVISD